MFQWSEYDSVDRTMDRYKLTIRPGATPLDVARTAECDLDSDSPQKIAVVDYLLDSRSGGDNRRICVELLTHPDRSVVEPLALSVAATSLTVARANVYLLL